jgi:hypothetical protein
VGKQPFLPTGDGDRGGKRPRHLPCPDPPSPFPPHSQHHLYLGCIPNKTRGPREK